jgi:two-component system, sensor histidine kinase
MKPPSAFAGEQTVASFRVLIVEDMPDAAQSLAAVARLWGYAVEIAYDGLAALDAVKSFGPHAVLADIGLPGMTGFDVAKSIKADPATGGVLLVATTAYADSAAQTISKAAGFAHHFTKPLDLDAVHAVLEEHRRGLV